MARGNRRAFGLHAGIGRRGRTGCIRLLPHRWIEAVTAFLFAAGAAYLLLVPGAHGRGGRGGRGRGGRCPHHPAQGWLGTAFAVIFVGEFGDLTQILTANLAAKYHDALSVFVGAFCALAAVAALGAFAGRALLRFVPLGVIRKAGGVLLAGFAIYSLVSLVQS